MPKGKTPFSQIPKYSVYETNCDVLSQVPDLIESITEITGANEHQINTWSPAEIFEYLNTILDDVPLKLRLYEELKKPVGITRATVRFYVPPFIRELMTEFCQRNGITYQRLTELAVMRFLWAQNDYLAVLSNTHPLFDIFIDALWKLSTIDEKIVPSKGFENTIAVLTEMSRSTFIDIDRTLRWFKGRHINSDADILAFQGNWKTFFQKGFKEMKSRRTT